MKLKDLIRHWKLMRILKKWSKNPQLYSWATLVRKHMTFPNEKIKD